MLNKINKETLKLFLPLAVLATLTCGLIYATAQQVYRQSANDPQVQIAEDISGILQKGAPPEAIVGQNKTDIGKSLAAFVIIYDSSRSAVISSAVLDGKTPVVPKGVFDSADKRGENIFTWEPKDAVREAVVLRKYQGSAKGYVLVGRSLREVEKRVDSLTKSIGIAWAVILVGTFATLLFVDSVVKKKKPYNKKT